MKTNGDGSEIQELVRAGRAVMVTRSTPTGEVTFPMAYKQATLVEKAADEGDEVRTVSIVASTPTEDSYGDVIVQTGWDLSRYKDNPVLLIDHWNRIQNVVGKASKIKKSKEALTMTGTLDDDRNETARTLRATLANGSVKKVSVGFMPIAWEKILDAEDNWTGGWKFLKQELLEVSFVAIPANPDASVTPEKGVTVPDMATDTTMEASQEAEMIDALEAIMAAGIQIALNNRRN